jgi:hypothetical protein
MGLELLWARSKYLWLMGLFMMDIGRIIKEMDMEYIIIRMGIDMRGHGVTIVECKMENFILLLVHNISENSLMMRSMEVHLDFLRTNLKLSLNCLMLKMNKAKVFLETFQMVVYKKSVKQISRMETSFKECF